MSNPWLGSDQEGGLRKGADKAFKDHMACTRHLEENLSAFMTDKALCDAKTRSEINKDLFSKSGGLASIEDTMEFEVALERFFQKYKDMPKVLHQCIILAPTLSMCSQLALNQNQNLIDSIVIQFITEILY